MNIFKKFLPKKVEPCKSASNISGLKGDKKNERTMYEIIEHNLCLKLSFGKGKGKTLVTPFIIIDTTKKNTIISIPAKTGIHG
jgi:hypothetical protein